MAEKERKVQVCRCDNCGNEAEMTVVCEWVTVKSEETEEPKKAEKRNFTCVNCGNEADMIITEE